MCPKLLNLQKKQEIHLFAHETSPLCVVTLHRGLCTRISNWKCYSLVRLLLSSLSRWASRGQWQRLAFRVTGLSLCRHLGWWRLRLKWYQWDGTKWRLCLRVISGQLSATDDGLSCERRRRLKDDGIGVHDLSIWGCQLLEKEIEGGTGGVGWGGVAMSSVRNRSSLRVYRSS